MIKPLELQVTMTCVECGGNIRLSLADDLAAVERAADELKRWCQDMTGEDWSQIEERHLLVEGGLRVLRAAEGDTE